MILFLCILHLQASSDVDVTWEIDSYYQDTNNKLDIDDILKIDKQNHFQNYPDSHAVFSKGFTKSTYWIKVLLHNKTLTNNLRDFQLDNSWLDEFNLYFVQNTKIIHQWENGDKKLYKKANNKYLHPRIKLDIPSGGSILYMKISSEEALIAPFTIDTPDNTTQATLIKLSFFSAIYAAVFIMALYNLFLFFSVKDRNYLLYTLFLVSFIVTNSSYSGFQYHLFLYDSLFLPSFLNAFHIFTYQYIGILFVMSFLDTKNMMPKVHRLLLAFIAIDVIIQVFTYILGLGHMMQTMAVISMTIFGPMLFAISLYALKNSTQSNRLFSLGLFFSLIGSTITALCAYGLLPYTFFYFHAVEFGFIIDAILISLSLASKLKYISTQLSDKVSELKAKEVQIQKEIQARLESERLSYENSKLANLGEMIGNIAHQWRQPLAQLAYINAFLHEHLSNKDDEVALKLKKTDHIIEFMSDTLNNFQNFYTNDNTQTNFNPSNAIDTVLDLTRHAIELDSIKITLQVDSTLNIYGNKNHYAQVVLALVQNSINAIEKRNVQNAFIHISLKQKDTKTHLSIEDNAEGISMTPIDKIFDLFVSNPKSSSTGIGLYMSKKIIVQKFHGTIEVQYNAPQKSDHLKQFFYSK